jgi:hypothetical protein
MRRPGISGEALVGERRRRATRGAGQRLVPDRGGLGHVIGLQPMQGLRRNIQPRKGLEGLSHRVAERLGGFAIRRVGAASLAHACLLADPTLGRAAVLSVTVQLFTLYRF